MTARGRVVVDTDAASALIFGRGHYERYTALLGDAAIVYSFAVAGELRAYAVRARLGDRRRRDIEQALGRSRVLRATDDVIDVYAELHSRLTDRLHRGGMNDMWTAACAAAHTPPLPVLTGDRKDFLPIASVIGLDLLVA